MPLGSGAPGSLGTDGAGALWPCPAWLAPCEGGLDHPDVVPAQGILYAAGRPVVPLPVQPVQVVRGIAPHVFHKAAGHIAP